MAFDHAKQMCQSLEHTPGCMQTALKILGDKWSPLLIGHLFEIEMTFKDLELALGGISSRTLSARLDELLDEGIINKTQYCAHPPRYKYGLTQKGQDLRSILVQMSRWGEKYRQDPIRHLA